LLAAKAGVTAAGRAVVDFSETGAGVFSSLFVPLDRYLGLAGGSFLLMVAHPEMSATSTTSPTSILADLFTTRLSPENKKENGKRKKKIKAAKQLCPLWVIAEKQSHTINSRPQGTGTTARL
jgi:hypothetical protein